MVVFACNACGESLKKNQVENHYNRKCRSCNVLSCLDCGKDFWGNDYEQHTKCISEEEKYSGKNFVPRPGANKNEIKQQQWFHQVQQAIDKAKTNHQLRSLLERLKDYPNIPRKEAKFINFLRSSVNCRSLDVCQQAWKAINEFVEKPAQVDKSKSTDDQSKDTVNEVTQSAGNVNGNSNTSEDHNQPETSSDAAKKLSKREKKEERRKKAHKSEKKDKQAAEPQENGSVDKPRKKKRKRDEEEDIAESVEEDRLVAENSVNNEEEDEEEAETSEPVRKKIKTKFDWAGTITEVLESKGPEMKMKKLRKKVLSEYLSQGCTEKTEEKLWAKFDKKVKRTPGVKVAGDKVKLTKPAS